MKDFSHFGTKIRKFPDCNYTAVWNNLKTIRLGNNISELPADKAEFYDISLGTKCNLQCPFCYTNALKNGVFYNEICDKISYLFGTMPINDRPFQVAIGSQSEPTLHPNFLEFIKRLYFLQIVPNYTTNGITIASGDDYSDLLLDITEKYCGGVAVSANTWNPEINKIWRKAADLLLDRDVYVNLHYIISDRQSIDNFKEIYDKYKDKVLNFVLLPLMKSGRSQEQYKNDIFSYLIEQDFDWSKIAFGAHFYDLLKTQDKIKVWLYPPESFSKNLILDDSITITPSSFNLNPIKTIYY